MNGVGIFTAQEVTAATQTHMAQTQEPIDLLRVPDGKVTTMAACLESAALDCPCTLQTEILESALEEQDP